MQIIGKPKKHRFPLSLNRKIAMMQKDSSEIPELDISKISNHRQNMLKPIPKIHYQFNIDDSHFRPIIRTSLSKNLTFGRIERKGKYSID